MSGFVSTSRECARTQSRSGPAVSPSNEAARTLGSTRERNDLSWSAASALVGARYRAVAFSSSSRAESTGSWYASDLPDAVPVAITTDRPCRARDAAAAWWAHGRVIPRARNRSTSSSGAQSCQSAERPGRGGTSSTWVTGSCLPPASTRSSRSRPRRAAPSGSRVRTTPLTLARASLVRSGASSTGPVAGPALITRRRPTRRCVMDLTLNTRDQGGHTVLAVSGEVDVYTAPALRDRIADLLDSGQHQLVIDLGGVEFLDSTGLGVLVAGLNRAREVGGSLSLVCPQERVLKLFRITGLDEVFTVHSTVDEALARRSGVGEELLDEVRLAVGEACARAVRLHKRHGVSSSVTVEFTESDR